MLITLENEKLIASLPIFAGLTKSGLHELLKSSHLKNYKKKATVFSEGDKIRNFYVVLRGWVKLFQTNEQGKEVVLQVVGANEGILETSKLFNDNFPVAAETAAKNTKILTISSSTFSSYIKDDQLMASNALAIMAKHSQKLMNQLSQITLKTPRQRVGSFLLNLFSQNPKKDNSLRLPYDKSLIAAHLGMRLETFSRSLCELKNDNKIIVEKNVITLREASFLCHYCDNESFDNYKCLGCRFLER